MCGPDEGREGVSREWCPACVRKSILTALVASVSSLASLLSQCWKYSSTAACWAALSFFSMADNPTSVVAVFLCMMSSKVKSRERTTSWPGAMLTILSAKLLGGYDGIQCWVTQSQYSRKVARQQHFISARMLCSREASSRLQHSFTAGQSNLLRRWLRIPRADIGNTNTFLSAVRRRIRRRIRQPCRLASGESDELPLLEPARLVYCLSSEISRKEMCHICGDMALALAAAGYNFRGSWP